MPKILMLRHPRPKEPTPAQVEAGNYQKRKLDWNGLKISIENEPGTVRSGVGPGGKRWSTRMHFAYGYVRGSTGVDGDQVDVYVGSHLDAPMAYVVHQRRAGDWKAYDEDKCMVGFLTEDDARSAYLACYDDPRFLGPITAMPVAEFIAKCRATKDNPQMIKAVIDPVWLLIKSYVGPYVRGGRTVAGYQDHRIKHAAAQGDLFGAHQAAPRPSAPPPPAKVLKMIAMLRRHGAGEDDPQVSALIAHARRYAATGEIDLSDQIAQIASRLHNDADRRYKEPWMETGEYSDGRHPGVPGSGWGSTAERVRERLNSLIASGKAPVRMIYDAAKIGA